MKKMFLLLFSISLHLVLAQGIEKEYILTDNSDIVFINAQQAAQILTANDDFMRSVSDWDRAASLKQPFGVTQDEFLENTRKSALNWLNADIELMREFPAKIHNELALLDLNLPQQIFLIKTSGMEEGGEATAYTRQNAIIFTQELITEHPKFEELLSIFTHELFHVYSRFNPVIRDSLYKIIGFRTVNNISLPAEWDALRITNPDAPLMNVIINVVVDSEEITVTPFFHSTEVQYDTTKPGGIFQFAAFHLLKVSQDDDGSWQPVFIDDSPVMYKPKEVSGYFEKIGRNTRYIIHPEEILADNFEFMVLGKKDLPNPEIISKMRKIISVYDQ